MQYFFVGTYSEPILFGTGEVFKGKGEGLYLCSFEDGKIETVNLLSMRNPSFLCIDEAYGKIYTVNELKEYEGEFGGGVSEVSFDKQGKLTLERSFCTKGTDPCHIACSPERDFVSISNFASGSVSIFRLDKNGRLKEHCELFTHEGHSVHPIRQKGPHAHSTIFTGKESMFVPDLGTDQLVGYRYKEGKIESDENITVSLAAGSGPRFGEFSPDHAHFYLINEIGSSVTHYLWDGTQLMGCDTVSTLPEDCTLNNICSDLHVTPDGKYLYASNRGHDSICAFAIGVDGALTLLDRVSCGGKTPRNFCIEPNGTYLLVGNQDSDTIVTFRIEASGKLTFVSETAFPTPVCMKFLYGQDDSFAC
ncbi:MAG: lactonase family protein [Clostridia bacterium]